MKRPPQPSTRIRRRRYLPTTKAQLVVPLPPILSIARFRRALDPVVAGLTGYLPIAVEHLTHTGGTNRMARPNQPAARINRHPGTQLDYTLLDCLP